MVYSSTYNLFLLKIFCQRLFIHSYLHSSSFKTDQLQLEAVFETMTISSTFVDEENASLLFSISMLFLCSPSWVVFAWSQFWLRWRGEGSKKDWSTPKITHEYEGPCFHTSPLSFGGPILWLGQTPRWMSDGTKLSPPINHWIELSPLTFSEGGDSVEICQLSDCLKWSSRMY